jgi:hypothetical protein
LGDRPQLTFVPGTLVPAGGVVALWAPGEVRTGAADGSNDPLLQAAERLGLPTGEPGTLETLELIDGGAAGGDGHVRDGQPQGG